MQFFKSFQSGIISILTKENARTELVCKFRDGLQFYHAWKFLFKFSVPVSPVLFFEILHGHIASPPRAKIGQALSSCERTGTNKQCFDERDKSCEERAFYRYLACLVFEYFETSLMSAKKEFLTRFLREKSGWSKLWKRLYICCLVPLSQKRKREENMKKVFILCFDALVA